MKYSKVEKQDFSLLNLMGLKNAELPLENRK